MTETTLAAAARVLGMTELQVVVRCALLGVPCDAGIVDDAVLPVLGGPQLLPAMPDQNPLAPAPEAPVDLGETDRERRERVLRRILEKLTTMGKWWPARIERRNLARGLAASDHGLAQETALVLVRCGLLHEEGHGGHEPRVGLVGERRAEIEAAIKRGEIEDVQLANWLNDA